MAISFRLPIARRSLLLAAFTLYCIPVIHAAAISGRADSKSNSVIHVTRDWLSFFTSGDVSEDTEGLDSVSATASDATAYLRIASLSIALYEWVLVF